MISDLCHRLILVFAIGGDTRSAAVPQKEAAAAIRGIGPSEGVGKRHVVMLRAAIPRTETAGRVAAGEPVGRRMDPRHLSNAYVPKKGWGLP